MGVKQPGNVLIKPKRAVDPDDVLTPEEGALVDKARQEMRQGIYIPLSKLERDLAHKRSPRRRKTSLRQFHPIAVSGLWTTFGTLLRTLSMAS